MSTVERYAGESRPIATPLAGQPEWLDRSVFPFESRYLTIEGNRIHYIDEGSGPVLLFLHGNPLWSFQYRHIVKALRENFRCIALDYPGFGLSEAHSGFTNTLKGNSLLVERFVEALGLHEITLGVFDTSVSIGLGVVERHPEWFRALVISNGFAWPLREDPSINRFIKIIASPFFRFMVINFNMLLRYTLSGFNRQNKVMLTPAEMRAYLMPFAEKSRRRHQHDLFRSIVDSEAYLLEVKNGLPKIKHLPTLLAFADNDPTYKAGWLDRYERIFPKHHSILIEGSHHFPHEYNPQAMVVAIRGWLEREKL